MKFENAVILEEIEPRFGTSNSKVEKKIISTGNNENLLPKEELQVGRYFDTWNCVTFSLLNSIEAYFKFMIVNGLISTDNYNWLVKNLYIQNGEVNFSDRYTGAKAGTKIGVGNSGRNVARAAQDWGLVPEVLYPLNYEMMADDYYKTPPTALDELAKEFQERFKVKVESYYLSQIEKVLKYAVPQAYVRAWYKDSEGIYVNEDVNKINHAITVYAKDDLNRIFDHYKPFKKNLDINYTFWPTGYYATVQEVINDKYMDVEKFVKEHDLVYVQNSETGQFGRIMQGKLKVIDPAISRGTAMLLDDKMRIGGKHLTADEWQALSSVTVNF